MSETQSESESVQAVVFDIGDSTYCVDIGVVAEIVDRGEITKVPGSDEHIEGVMDLRGETTPIFNPRSYFGSGETIDNSGGRILIVERPDGDIGWIVDEVDRVIEFDRAEIDTATTGDGIQGILRNDSGFILFADTEAIHA